MDFIAWFLWAVAAACFGLFFSLGLSMTAHHKLNKCGGRGKPIERGIRLMHSAALLWGLGVLIVLTVGAFGINGIGGVLASRLMIAAVVLHAGVVPGLLVMGYSQVRYAWKP